MGSTMYQEPYMENIKNQPVNIEPKGGIVPYLTHKYIAGRKLRGAANSSVHLPALIICLVKDSS